MRTEGILNGKVWLYVVTFYMTFLVTLKKLLSVTDIQESFVTLYLDKITASNCTMGMSLLTKLHSEALSFFFHVLEKGLSNLSQMSLSGNTSQIAW